MLTARLCVKIVIELGKNMTTEEFNENLKKIVKGDKDAWRALYEEYYAYVYFTAYTRLKNRQDAEDIATDVIISLCSASNDETVRNPKSYLFVLTVNKVKNFYEKYYSRRSAQEIEYVRLTDPVAQNEQSAIEIGDLLEYLPQDEREIFVNHVLWDIPFTEIARQEGGLSLSTVKRKYKHACAVLRKLLKDANNK